MDDVAIAAERARSTRIMQVFFGIACLLSLALALGVHHFGPRFELPDDARHAIGLAMLAMAAIDGAALLWWDRLMRPVR